MQGSAGIPGRQPDACQPFTISLSPATSVGLSRRWVQYSGAMKSAGDSTPILDREYLAYFAGLDRADQLDPYLDEVQQLGFLTVDEDRFSVSLHPPAGYTGPRNLTEAYTRFAAASAEAFE